MNNSFLAEQNVFLAEEVVDRSEELRTREVKVLQLLEAIKNIQSSKYWELLESEIFKPNMQRLDNLLRKEKDLPEIYRLQGKLAEAERCTDLAKLRAEYMNELTSLRTKLDE